MDDNNNGSNIGVATPVAGTEPVNPPANPLGNLEDALIAAKQAAQATEAPVAPNPLDAFNNQFGSGANQSPVTTESVPPTDVKPAAETPIDIFTDTHTASETKAVEDLPTKNPAEELKEKISEDVDTFLAEETKEKAAV